ALDRAAAAGHRNPDPGPGRAEAAGRKEAGSGRGMGPEPDPVPGRDRAADIDHHTAVDKEHCRTAEAAGTLPGLDLEVAPGFGPALDTERMNWDTGGAADRHLAAGPDPRVRAAETDPAGPPRPTATAEALQTCPPSSNPDPQRPAAGSR